MKNSRATKKPSIKANKKSTQKKKYLLRGKPVRIPGNDRGKVIIMPDFDAPLPEFDL